MTKEEAINNFKKVLGFSPIYDEAFYTLFPEFVESEDERIRKEIRNFLIDMECKKEWIAYMEKQKEQKPIDIQPIFEVGDVMRTKEEAEKDWKDGMPVVVSIDSESYHCNNELIAIKDQYDYEYPPMNRKQKPAEWSEESKSIEELIAFLHYYHTGQGKAIPFDEKWIIYLEIQKERWKTRLK